MTDVDDIECLDSNECLDNSVVKVCYTTLSGNNSHPDDDEQEIVSSFCDCSTWYGWEGIDCDEPSFQLQYFRVVMILFLVWYFILLVILIKDIIEYLVRQCHKRLKLKAVFYTSLLLLIGVIFGVLSVVFTLGGLFDSTQFEVVRHKLYGREIVDVLTTYGLLPEKFAIIGFTFTFLAALQISISWFSVIDSVAMFEEKTMWVRLLKLFKLFVAISVLFFAAFVLSFLFTDKLSSSQYLSPILCWLLVLIYLVGRSRFVTTIQTTSLVRNEKSKSDMERPIYLVNRSSFFIILALTGLGFSLLAYYILELTYREDYLVGEFNWVLFVRHLAKFFVVLNMTTICWYTHQFFKVFKSRTETKHMPTDVTNITREMSRRIQLKNSIPTSPADKSLLFEKADTIDTSL